MDGIHPREQTVSADDAVGRLGDLLRQVADGARFVLVGADGAPLATLAPLSEADREQFAAMVREEARREAAKRAILERVRKQPFTLIEPWTREELYEDDRG